MVDHAGAGGAEHLAELGLRPDRAEHPGARTDRGDRLVAQHVRCERPRQPVDGVLEDAWDRRVVLGGGEEDGVGLGDRRAKLRDGLRAAIGVVVLVVRRDLLQPVVDLELHALGLEQLADVAQECCVV